MPLIYAFVARRTTVLAEYTGYSGNFSTIATQVRVATTATTRREGDASSEFPGERAISIDFVTTVMRRV